MASSESRDWGFGIGDSQRRIHSRISPALGGADCQGSRDRSSESRIPNSKSRATSVAQRLAGLEHVPDARLGLLLLRQLDEVPALQAQQPFLVDHGAAVDLAAAQHGGDAGGDLVVVFADEAALE